MREFFDWLDMKLAEVPDWAVVVLGLFALTILARDAVRYWRRGR